MRRTTKIIAASFLVAILGVVTVLVFLPGHPANPVYAGRPLSDWVRNWGAVEFVPGSNIPIRTNVTALDSNAAPYLVNVLHHQDGPWATWYQRTWPKLPTSLRQHLAQPFNEYELRSHALTMLGDSGPGSRETIAALLEVAESVGRPGSRGIGFAERNEAIASLGKIGTNNPAAIQGLSRLIEQGTNLSMTSPAIRSLGLIGGQSQPAVDLLVEDALDSRDSRESILALKQMGHQGNLGVQGLVRVYRESGDNFIFDDALDALKELGSDYPEAMDALVLSVRKSTVPGNKRGDAMYYAAQAKDPHSAGMRAVIAVALNDNEDLDWRMKAWEVMEMAHGRNSSLFPDGRPRQNEDIIADIRARANAELQSLNAPQNPPAH